MTPKAKYALIGCGVLAVLAGLALAAVLALRSIDWSVKDIEVTLDAPESVQRGEQFEITARVRNTGSTRQRLFGIDVDGDYLRGIAIRSAEPPWKEVTDILGLAKSYTFKTPIEPGQEIVIVLHASALRTGDFGGDVDFCVNSDFTYLTLQARTVVSR